VRFVTELEAALGQNMADCLAALKCASALTVEGWKVCFVVDQTGTMLIARKGEEQRVRQVPLDRPGMFQSMWRDLITEIVPASAATAQQIGPRPHARRSDVWR